MMVRAAGYFRVSTARQAGAEHYSLPVQRDLFAARCLERGYEVGPEYVDTESGRTASRRGYQQLLTDARAGKFDVIVVRDITRFGRDADEITERTSELRTLGITLDAIVTFVPDSEMAPQVRFLLRSIESFLAAQSSADTSSRVRGSMRASAALGHWQGGPAPFGYRVEGGVLVEDHAAASVVRSIFEAYVTENRSMLQITRRLNERGVPPPKGARWWPTVVSSILRRRTYTGRLEWADVAVEGAVPAIIPLALYEAAEARRSVKRTLPAGRTQVSRYLLSGLAWCGFCEGRMLGHVSTDRRGVEATEARGYVCAEHRRNGACELNWNGADRTEQAVLAALDRMIVDFDALASSLADQAAEVSARLAAVERDLARIPARLRQNLERAERGQLSEALLAMANEGLEADRQRLTTETDDLRVQLARVDAERTRQALSATTRPFTPAFDALTVQQQKAWLQNFVARITLRRGEAPRISLRT